MSKLWSAIQSHYRPSAAYQVSVVLIEATKPAPCAAAGAVARARRSRTQRDRGVVVNADLLPPLPTLFDATPPAKQTAARLGEALTIDGVRLSGSGHRVRLTHRLVSTPIELVPVGAERNGHAAHRDAAQRRRRAERATRRGNGQLTRALHADRRAEPARDQRRRRCCSRRRR